MIIAERLGAVPRWLPVHVQHRIHRVDERWMKCTSWSGGAVAVALVLGVAAGCASSARSARQPRRCSSASSCASLSSAVLGRCALRLSTPAVVDGDVGPPTAGIEPIVRLSIRTSDIGRSVQLLGQRAPSRDPVHAVSGFQARQRPGAPVLMFDSRTHGLKYTAFLTRNGPLPQSLDDPAQRLLLVLTLNALDDPCD